MQIKDRVSDTPSVLSSTRTERIDLGHIFSDTRSVPVFLRKSLRAGPLRFNLSKSGIGVSAGIPGLRVGLIGPRGHYIYAGRNGLYYRKTLNGPHQTVNSPAGNGGPHLVLPDASEPMLEDITGATVMQMAASAPSDLVANLTHSANIQSVWGWAALFGLVVSAAGFGVFWPVGIPLAVATIAAAWWLRQRDIARKAVVVFYDINDQYADSFAAMTNDFTAVSGAQRLRRVLAHGGTSAYQQKTNAGATSLENLVPVTANDQGPKQLTTNVTVTPCIGFDLASLTSTTRGFASAAPTGPV